MRILIQLSIAMFGGLLMSRLAKKLNLPAVTAYLVAGVLLGPSASARWGCPDLAFIPRRKWRALI